ncbi:hypothetical protein BJY24_003296 [Nocardia transvalensis]|uniref:DUF5753 domain-containing protein n=1 Tax=Nocardia transvalensis TaxID=37333 RepID=A0A7W9PF06_9NOCA|nr:hypothetical protein [Nocardia transvalensis]
MSKIEYGRTRPTDDDIRAYCAHADADDQQSELLAVLHNIDSAYLEWRRALGSGIKHRQQQYLKLETEATFIRNYQPQIIPGLLQTADYAEAKLRRAAEFHGISTDVDSGVSKRLERQQILYRRKYRCHFLMGEQSLRTTVGGNGVMIGQLDRLSSMIGMPRVTLGIVPAESEALVVASNFAMYDNRLVLVEGVSAELRITQPREIALYGRAFDTLARQSVTGDAARELIGTILESRRRG